MRISDQLMAMSSGPKDLPTNPFGGNAGVAPGGVSGGGDTGFSPGDVKKALGKVLAEEHPGASGE